MFQLNLKDNIKLVYILKNKIPFEIFTPTKIVKSLLTVAIATIKAYCDKYTYILVNHTKQDQIFLFTLRLRYTWHLHSYRKVEGNSNISKVEGNSNQNGRK